MIDIAALALGFGPALNVDDLSRVERRMMSGHGHNYQTPHWSVYIKMECDVDYSWSPEHNHSVLHCGSMSLGHSTTMAPVKFNPATNIPDLGGKVILYDCLSFFRLSLTALQYYGR